LIQIVTIHRRHVLAGLLSGLAGASPALAGASQAHIPTVLFVCQFGSVKSSAAREIFKRRAAARGIAVNVFSRGITPEAHASPALKARLHVEPSPSNQRAASAAGPSARQPSARLPGRAGSRCCMRRSIRWRNQRRSACARSVRSSCGQEMVKVASALGSGIASRCCGSAKPANAANSLRRPSRTCAASSPR